MSVKTIVQRLCAGIIIVLSGLVITLRQFGIGTSIIPPWYTIAIVALGMICLIIGIINRVDMYYYISFALSGFFLASTVAFKVEGITLLCTWPIILISLGIGIIVAQIVNKKSRLKATIGAALVVVFTPILAGLWTNTWKYIVPIMFAISGIVLIAYTLYTKKKIEDGKQVKGDYYVRPSSEKLENIDNSLKETDNNEKSDTAN